MEKQDYITPIICVLLIIGMIGGCIAIFSNNSSSGGTNSSSDSEIVDDSDTSSDGSSHTHMLKTVSKLLPTCTESGYAAYQYCLKCNYTTKGEDIDALGHDITIVNTATCTEGGQIYESCSRCDYTYIGKSDVIDCIYDKEGVCTMCNIPKGSVILNGTFEFLDVLPEKGALLLVDTCFTYNGIEYEYFSYQHNLLQFIPRDTPKYELGTWIEKGTITFDNVMVPLDFYEGFQYMIKK